jgi:hypothetical protein
MADDAASVPEQKPPPPPSALMDTARRVLGQVVARVPGLHGDAAQRNAWEAVCADLQRRQQWNDVVDLAVNADRRPTLARPSGNRQPANRPPAARPPHSSPQAQSQTQSRAQVQSRAQAQSRAQMQAQSKSGSKP